jgi:hypothetical protein
MLAAIAFGAWTGFPIYDDAYLLLYPPHQGPASIAATSAERPIVALLLKGFVDLFALNRLPYIVIDIVFWIILAWQTWQLSRFFFKDEFGAAVVSSLVFLSPILVKTQYTTIITLFTDNLPVSICLAALLFSVRHDVEHRLLQLIFVGLLIFVACSISEYGVATVVASIAVLLVFQKHRTALVIFLGALLGYILFQSIGDFRIVPGKTASVQYNLLTQGPLSAISRFFASLWHSFIGCYGAAASKITLEAGSRSTIVAAFAGVVSMLIVLRWFRNLGDDQKQNDARKSTIAICLAVVCGLIPVVLGSRSLSDYDSYETRYAIPILPFATIATVRGALNLTASRFRPWIAAFLTFVAMYTVIIGAFEKRNQQKIMEEFGRVMMPIAKESDEITVVVVPDYEKMYSVDITPKVVSKWPAQLAKRFWVLRESEAREHFDFRTECRDTSSIKEEWWFSTVSRRGPVSQIFFVPSFWTSESFSNESLEPYCVESSS